MSRKCFQVWEWLKLLFAWYGFDYVDQLFGMLAWSWTLNKSWSLSGVEQTLFLD